MGTRIHAYTHKGPWQDAPFTDGHPEAQGGALTHPRLNSKEHGLLVLPGLDALWVPGHGVWTGAEQFWRPWPRDKEADTEAQRGAGAAQGQTVNVVPKAGNSPSHPSLGTPFHYL